MMNIPEPLKSEHDDLHRELVRATGAGGRTGEAARAVAKLLHPHFQKEEADALPLLGLLKPLAAGDEVADADQARAAAKRLKQALPSMLAEHREIEAALGNLSAAAQEEGHHDHAQFAQKLALHARTEEEVLYPAAILVAELLELRRG
jgi:ferritin